MEYRRAMTMQKNLSLLVVKAKLTVSAGTDTLNAKRIAVRLQEELQSVRAKHGGAFETTVHNYPDDAQSSHELEDIVKSVLPAKDDYGVAAPMPAPAKAQLWSAAVL